MRVAISSSPQWPVVGIAAGPVEDDDSARTANGDEVGEPVDELALVAECAGVEQVVPVEEVEGRLSHPALAIQPRLLRPRPNGTAPPAQLSPGGRGLGMDQIPHELSRDCADCGTFQRPLRWRAASYSSSAAATLTFSDSTEPASGIDTVASQVRRTSGRSPFPSAPNTSAAPSVRSVSQRDASPSAAAPNTHNRGPFASARKRARFGTTATRRCSTAP